jgi:hypothetical protein
VQAFGSLTIAVDAPADAAGLSYAILYRHLFMNRQDLRLPTGLLVDAGGNVVKVYRGGVEVEEIVADASAIDASPAERLARAIPFPGTFYSGLPLRNYLLYGSELLDNGREAAAVTAFTLAAAWGSPSRSNNGKLSGSNDSPMWKRGKRSFSRTTTCFCCCARRDAMVDPAGPPPTTSTSHSEKLFMMTMHFTGTRIALSAFLEISPICDRHATRPARNKSGNPGTLSRLGLFPLVECDG